MRTVLLLLATSTYRAHDLLAAVGALGVGVIVGCERQQVLEPQTDDTTVTLTLADPERAVTQILELAGRHRIDAVLGLDDETAFLAASAAAALGLPHADPKVVQALGNKATARQMQRDAGLPCPGFRLFERSDDPGPIASVVAYPCVLKPTFLSASRGVIRANDEEQFIHAFERIGQLLAQPDVRERGGEAAQQILVEEYVPGDEVALEGVLRRGQLQQLALFDKPDPLVGPFFEETIYVTPSRLPEAAQTGVHRTVERFAAAIGLKEGAVHAELRLDDGEPVLIELAPRAIGGLCSRMLRFGTGISLEELILRHALGEPTATLDREPTAAGVMMIPIPRGGVLRKVEGVAEASGVAGVESVEIAIRRGQPVVPLPEGNRYLGFIFARAPEPSAVEAALRTAHGALRFQID